MNNVSQRLQEALWKIFNRPEQPEPWQIGGNLPWNDSEFSERMLREHLDEGHGAATRQQAEREMQLDWLWQRLSLRRGAQLLDVTCGPGLYAVPMAQRGCQVTGVDFSPASIAYAKDAARTEGVSDRCQFVEQDIREMYFEEATFDAATLIYGQLSVFKKEEARDILANIARMLKPGGKLCVELLNEARIDKTDSTWWYTDQSRLWDEKPFLHLGERFWHAETEIAIERFQTIHLETGALSEVYLCDQAYRAETMRQMMLDAGFSAVEIYPAWDNLALYDAEEWIVYLAQR